MMLFGDWRAARSVRIFLRSPLHGCSETGELTTGRCHVVNNKAGFQVQTLSARVCDVCLYLAQEMLVASAAGMDAPAALQ